MLIPYNVDVPMARWPIANWALIGVTVVVSLVMMTADHRRVTIDPDIMDDPTPEKIQEMRERIMNPPPPRLSLVRGKFNPIRLISYTLVHADVLHLLGNMIFLFVFGNAINAKLGHAAFLAWYFLLGAVAGLAWLALGSGAALVGASGAIMGLTGMFLVFYPRNDVRIFYSVGFVGGGFEVSSYWLVLFYMTSDLFFSLVDPNGGVAYVCHLGGELVGLGGALGLLMLGMAQPTMGEANLLQVLGFHPPTARDGKEGRRKRRVDPLPIMGGKPKRRPRPAEEEPDE
ncbi:MAG: rhomboid family intramembrane serine protease [Gemmataceae bacterium]|nr:rhomboid family intramembrane serine protease [Gemmataceae bacterium]